MRSCILLIFIVLGVITKFSENPQKMVEGHVENHIKWSITYIVPHGVVTNTTARRQE